MQPQLATHDQIRGCFTALHEPEVVYLDNAGGSQVPASTIEAMERYLGRSYVQMGADYSVSQRATGLVEQARQLLLRQMGGEGLGEVVMGPSTSVLCHHLAGAFAGGMAAGSAAGPIAGRDEIIVSDAGHESNIGPWVRLERAGYKVRIWRTDPHTTECPLEGLAALLNERTAVVAMHHVSNILGRIEPIAEVCRMARDVGARSVIDGVAFAPHRPVDVATLGCDFYVFSTYKVYGPHMAVMFGRTESWNGLVGPNHFFVPEGAVPYRWELGGTNHEGCAGLLGTAEYLQRLAASGSAVVPSREPTREELVAAFQRMASMELPLQRELIEFLNGHEDYRIVGPDTHDAARVATVSFVHRNRSSESIAKRLNADGVAVRYGHFYAHRLLTALGLEPDDGVIRASFVHYNSADDVAVLIRALSGV